MPTDNGAPPKPRRGRPPKKGKPKADRTICFGPDGRVLEAERPHLPPPKVSHEPQRGMQYGFNAQNSQVYGFDEKAQLQKVARQFTWEAVAVLVDLMRDAEDEKTKMSAAIHILDRGWGKPTLPLANDPENPLVPRTDEIVNWLERLVNNPTYDADGNAEIVAFPVPDGES